MNVYILMYGVPYNIQLEYTAPEIKGQGWIGK